VVKNNEKDIVNDGASNKSKIVKELGLNILSVAILGLLLWKFVIYSVWIESGSMIPTLEVKDRLIATRVHNPEKLKVGDIVIFNSEELDEILIKRLIGLPGDKIEIKNGIVFRNGDELQADYVKNNEIYNGVFEVPEEKYFFLGDNRAHSHDSRYWENPYIDASEIDGKAVLKYYPIKDFEVIK